MFSMNDEESRKLAHFLTALCDGTRLRLLSLMKDSPVSVGYLADSTAESQPKVSRHLAYLRGADLVSTERDGKHIYYRLQWPEDPAQKQIISAVLGGNTPIAETQIAEAPDVYAETYMTEPAEEEMEVYLL